MVKILSLSIALLLLISPYNIHGACTEFWAPNGTILDEPPNDLEKFDAIFIGKVTGITLKHYGSIEEFNKKKPSTDDGDLALLRVQVLEPLKGEIAQEAEIEAAYGAMACNTIYYEPNVTYIFFVTGKKPGLLYAQNPTQKLSNYKWLSQLKSNLTAKQ
ncbi:MAG: hypothetical protein Q8Q08_08665 [Candidatus Omnitrophota bacterium]|nr:hypothetical protein [Candidatus Omnitrophota bacterium]MDZ4241769.1 hypothetical protein [Candidatus Omnitrophota bacterium]